MYELFLDPASGGKELSNNIEPGGIQGGERMYELFLDPASGGKELSLSVTL